ncbi:uncharacterized protein K460DRAFT_333623 [Cucurbitaria berberidis CBS 394.84]|uniref:Uncharacterized protein n=1 Tax=Cucurbitaria berberidis CBS 394.84 TaxID=1168544 RepID=A0A9P4GMP3_9PLEO|nr:uncharacterized protein K460DRAFT_333623 [Cucurbitaria berberidis CBS 394.84]KAF1848019.1 hypothetical protein K460DRAFT_333623 [Cucurbitaria berberidis CBS 394.84]
MPVLPFHSATPSPSTSPTLSHTPSIVLHPASGASSKRELHKPKQDPAEAYRHRYAQYLAATFNMSIQAAMAEADTQLAPRRSSSISEAESLREI